MPKLTMRLEFGFYSNDPDGRTELRLVDDSTGFLFVRLQMNAHQFRDFLGTGGIKVDADIPSMRTMALLGSTMEVETVRVAHEVYAGDKYSMSQAPPSVIAFAKELEVVRQAAAGDKVVQTETRNTNSGWQVLVRTYTLREDMNEDGE